MGARLRLPRLAFACAIACAAVGGCAGLPRIDPSGNRVFIWPKDQPKTAAIVLPSSTVVAPPVGSDPFFPPTPVATAPVTAAPVLAAPGVTTATVALAQTPQDKVNITPERILAPVGSEVILKASVCAIEGYTLADQKVEWMLGRNGVGQFVEVSGKGLFHPAWLPWNKPKKVDNYLATGWTATDKLCIDRGTPDPADDVAINRGDAWISVTSPNEGTSYVTAYIPSVESWDTRRSSATIYWVDVQWNFPPPTVAGGGRSATLTTTITRQSNHTPIEGWLVRYELADGGGNLSGGAGGQVVEVRTDAEGRATVVATPTAAGAATTPVNVQLIRPAGFGGSDAPRLVVGTGTSIIQWGGDSTYLPPAAGPIPTPAPTPAPGGYGSPPTPAPTLPTTPGGSAPPVGSTPPVTGGPAFPSTPAQRPQLVLTLEGDDQAFNGGQAQLKMIIRNTGTAPATNVQVEDRIDPGLMDPQHPDSSLITFTGIGTVQPGETKGHTVLFSVNRAGRLCHNVTVRAAENVDASARKCVTASEPAVQKTGVVKVRKEGPLQATVGETIRFRITVKNEGEVALTDVRVIDEYPTTFFQVKTPADLNTQVVSGTITRVIPRLEIGTSKVFEVECLCQIAGLPVLPRPRVRVEAQTEPKTTTLATNDDVDMEIRPARAAGGPGGGAGAAASPALLKVDVQGAATGRVGTATTCVVTVVNSSTRPDENVELRIGLPPQLTPNMDALKLNTPAGIQPTRDADKLVFSAIPLLQPGERRIFTIPMMVGGPPGFVEIVADVRSRNVTTSDAQKRVTIEILGQ